MRGIFAGARLSRSTVFFKAVVCAAVLGLTLLAGCAGNGENLSPIPSINPETKADLKAPVNCKTGRRDIAILEEERASIAKRIFSGVRSVFPIAVVAGILMGDYNDRFEVAIGQYNQDIEAKIAQIRRTCGF